MKVLMFGWEFPPKIYGGLAVASYGITKGLSLQGDMETIFCMPKPSGEEEKFLKIIGMNQLEIPFVGNDTGRILLFPRSYLCRFFLYAC